jgi:hypothetical protein
MPIFYGLYVADERMAAAFDLIRFFGEPYFVRRAHITVRGPYPNRLPIEAESKWRGKQYQIHFCGVDSFFSVSQNTVFLKCDIPGIEAVWDKPDYGGQITPHLTLYDGKNSTLGYDLLNELKKRKWTFSIESTELMVIQAKARPPILDDLVAHQKLYDEILGQRIDYHAALTLTPKHKLVYIECVANFLQREYAG